MSPIVAEFNLDLERLRTLLSLIEKMDRYPASSLPTSLDDSDEFWRGTVEIHGLSQTAHSGLRILPGIMIPYLAGRFEHAVRSILEDLSDSLAYRVSSFDALPEKMQKNPVARTGELMTNPKKFGCSAREVHPLVATLAENLTQRPLGPVNSSCLSITTENMRPDTLSKLFARVGMTKLWDRLGEQAALNDYDARFLLSDLMETRNRIAHPSGGFEWPSMEKVKQFIDFCGSLITALSEVAQVFAESPPESPRSVS